MANDKVNVKTSTGEYEDLYFKEQEQKKIKCYAKKSLRR